ncbi:MAG TPA: alpha amylase N-terminal ig-like domain-containing protein [Longilinea sp.]|nr:alpha amylase N-terminal ig-like domain-containing protein [Longilinea sp.]
MEEPIPVWSQSLHHDGSSRYFQPSQPRLGEAVTLRLRVSSSAPVRRIFLRIEPDGEQQFLPMEITGETRINTWWQITVNATEPVLHYRFLIDSADGFLWLNAAGLQRPEPLDQLDFRSLIGYAQPVWLLDRVLYQIFPDTFANGNPANDPKPMDYEYRGFKPKTFPWGSLPAVEDCNGLNFFGGDLVGIQNNLDYLQDLGVNCLFLNPIFSSFSNHKYDINDFYQVDDHFGGNVALRDLSAALHARDMRLLLDITPNHTSRYHQWFLSAQKDPVSPEAGFYTFDNHPEGYVSWLGHKNLPKLNYTSLELRRRMFTNPDAVVKYWLSPPYLVDGYRVDVGNMMARQGDFQMNREIGREMRKAIKSANSSAYILGENFFDATDQLQGDMWDGVMNYSGFTFPLINWLSGAHYQSWNLSEPIIDPKPYPTTTLVSAWKNHLAAVPWQVALQQYNLLGSHDIARLIDRLGFDPQWIRLAVAVQFTFPGLPGIYYGDEVGLKDVPGLGARDCMPWDQAQWDHDLRSFYQKMAQLRKSSPALQTGGFKVLSVEKNSLVFLRESHAERWIIQALRTLHSGDKLKITSSDADLLDGMVFTDIISGITIQCKHGYLQLPEPKQGVAVWRYVE